MSMQLTLESASQQQQQSRSWLSLFVKRCKMA